MSALTPDADSRDQTAVLAELRPRLVMFFSQKVRPMAVDDLVSDTTIRVLGHLSEGRPIQSVGPYTWGVAKLVFLEYIRRRGQNDDSIEELGEKGWEPSAPAAAVLEDVSPERQALARCWATLKPQERDFLKEYFGEGENKSNRAALMTRLGITRVAMEQRAAKGKRRLRECVAARLGETVSLRDMARRKTSEGRE